MSQRICQIDGCEKRAPYGYRKAGLLSEIKPPRGYLWVCADHREEAESRKAKAEQTPIQKARQGVLL